MNQIRQKHLPRANLNLSIRKVNKRAKRYKKILLTRHSHVGQIEFFVGHFFQNIQDPIISIPITAHNYMPRNLKGLSLEKKKKKTKTFLATSKMWDFLPFDLLSRIFSFLSPDSLAIAASTCHHWYTCTKTYPSHTSLVGFKPHPPWFLAMSTRNSGLSCYAYNQARNLWHLLPLDFLPDPIRPISPIGSFILCKPASSSSPLQLAFCNPFNKQYKILPLLNTLRINPAVGVVEIYSNITGDPNSVVFRIYVAGGMAAEAPKGGASYEPTLEMYDSQVNKWETIGWMPVEFAVRLTVWTPNESVYSDGILYWITSARAYTVMGFEICSGLWKEVKVPMAAKLEFSALVRIKERLVLVGGSCEGEAWIWGLGIGESWVLIEKVPVELGNRFLGCKGSWCNTKSVGNDEGLYLYRDLGCGMLVWKEVSESGKWEWFWVDGCSSIRGKKVPNFPIKGVLINPSVYG